MNFDTTDLIDAWPDAPLYLGLALIALPTLYRFLWRPPLLRVPSEPKTEAAITEEAWWDSLHLHSQSWSREVESPSDQAAEAAVAMARASLRMAERSLTASAANASEDTPEGEAAAQRLAQLRAELINSDGLGVPELATLGAERTAQLRHLVALCNAFFPAVENAVEQYAQLVAESPETLLEADQQ
jgi:hypothetical protein